MNWSLDDIERNLLKAKASVLALPSDMVMDAVNRVETILGHDWIIAEMKATGIAPAMTVIGMGLRLAALGGLAKTEALLANLRRNDQNAEAELTALYLIRGQDSPLEIELEPPVGTRKADFRVRKQGESVWTTVEVTQAMPSNYQKHLYEILKKILNSLEKSTVEFSLEVIFRREPTEAESASLISELLTFCSRPGQQQATLRDDLGFILLNHTGIKEGRTIEIAGLGPTIGIMMFVGGGSDGGPHHKVSLQIPFTDDRAEEILRTEARQLPKDEIGLIMVNASGGPGKFDTWTSLINKRLQPSMHTRVSAVCLFEGSMIPNGSQYDWLIQTKLIENKYAHVQLPLWIKEIISATGKKFEQALNKIT